MKGAYYNEIDPYAAQWLRNLIAAGHIAPGEVDERSILDVRADELRGFTQCHFFAGIGVWSYALRRAGWPDDRPVWTGSCPCQPFSVAGKGEGHADERHLWPAWFGLIGESRPVRIFGEQVADGDGYAWLDDVGHDLESIDYALGAVCSAACGFGAPCERQRTYFVADADQDGREQGSEGRPTLGHRSAFESDRSALVLGDPARGGHGSTRVRLDQLPRQASLAQCEGFGLRLTGSIVETLTVPVGAQLNAGHSRWLQGLPPEWDACAPTETRSTLSKRRTSSAPPLK